MKRDADSILDDVSEPPAELTLHTDKWRKPPYGDEIRVHGVRFPWCQNPKTGEWEADLSIEAIGIHRAEPTAERGYADHLIRPTQNWARDKSGGWAVTFPQLPDGEVIVRVSRWLGERCTRIEEHTVRCDGTDVGFVIAKGCGDVPGYSPPPPSGMVFG